MVSNSVVLGLVLLLGLCLTLVLLCSFVKDETLETDESYFLKSSVTKQKYKMIHVFEHAEVKSLAVSLCLDTVSAPLIIFIDDVINPLIW